MAKRPMWTGKLIDANGRVGRLEMDVLEGGQGSFTLELQERDGSPAVLKGQVTFATEGGKVRLRSSPQGEQRGGGVEWDAELTRAEAGRYAQAAMFGTYGSVGAGGERPLSRGVVILWQFA